MTKSYASVHEHMHECYRQGKSGPWGRMLEWSARSIFKKAKIAENYKRAKILRKILDEKFKAADFDDEQSVHEIGDLHFILVECHEVITDDLLIISAFETMAKRRLMGKCYVIHEIENPRDLRSRQRRSPIHARTIKAYEDRGESVTFRENTIGIHLLMQKGYRKRISFPDDLQGGIEIARKRRNLIHFRIASFYTVEIELLDLVAYLDDFIPVHR